MADNNLFKLDVDIVDAIREIKASYAKFKENKAYGKEQFEQLLTKYGDAIKLINQLQGDLATAKANKLPSADEIDNALTLIDSLDAISAAMPKLEQLKKQADRLNRKGYTK